MSISIIIASFILVAPAFLQAQANCSLQGKITDTSEAPIIGATVIVLGTTRGAVTKFDGTYHISGLRAGTYTIRIKSAGKATVERQAIMRPQTTSTLNVILGPDTTIEVTPTPTPIIKTDPVGTVRPIKREDIEGEFGIRLPDTSAHAFPTQQGNAGQPDSNYGLIISSVVDSINERSHGALRGKIVEEDSAGLAGAIVLVTGTKLGATTKVNGTFLVSEIPAGEYVIRVRSLGKDDKEQTVQILAGDTTTIFVMLKDTYYDYEFHDQFRPPKRRIKVEPIDPPAEPEYQRASHPRVDPETTGKVIRIYGEDLIW